MKTMQVEVLEDRLRGTDRVSGKHHEAHKGDRLTVSEECGRAWCAHGWVQDVAGEVETGDRKVRGKRLDPDKLTTATKAKRKEG